MGINKQQIMDNYVKEQGYEDWSDLINNTQKHELEVYYDEIIDLIQDELKKKIAKNLLGKTIIGVEKTILNTENL